MKTEVVGRLEKLEKKDISREIEAPNGEKQDLIYSNEWERSMEEFFKLGDEAQENPFKLFPKKVEQIQEFVSKIAELRLVFFSLSFPSPLSRITSYFSVRTLLRPPTCSPA